MSVERTSDTDTIKLQVKRNYDRLKGALCNGGIHPATLDFLMHGEHNHAFDQNPASQNTSPTSRWSTSAEDRFDTYGSYNSSPEKYDPSKRKPAGTESSTTSIVHIPTLVSQVQTALSNIKPGGHNTTSPPSTGDEAVSNKESVSHR
ncbi:hypothetical protein D6C97_04177 [Aureobasidium pullulans]|nr:hypothetical protein D6C97_04177 [Aureobasidium pullulans]TIA42590.1 hypothetical protein D6C79_07003 [Aureobasidium pullulans]